MMKASDLLPVAHLGAVVAGIVVSIQAFEPFVQTYSYLPLSAVVALFAFAVVAGLVLLLITWTGSGGRGRAVLTAIAASIGVGLAAYGFAAWKLSYVAFAIFPPAIILAVAIVGYAADLAKPTTLRVSLLSLLAGAAFLAPSVVITTGLYETEIFLPEILRRVVIASFLSILFSCTMLALGAHMLRRLRDVGNQGASRLHQDLRERGVHHTPTSARVKNRGTDISTDF